MQSKSNRRINAGQLEILDLLFKFRFGTSELIAEITNKKNGTAIRSRLNILCRRGLIDRHYNAADRLQGRYAAYYLLPEGLRQLQRYEVRKNIPESITKNIYKNQDASRRFIDHCLNIFSVNLLLSKFYGNKLKAFTKTELSNYEYFPRPLPDLFISLKETNEAKRYFLEIIEPNTPGFALNRRLKQYAEYYESEDWEATNSEFPAILFVCNSDIQQRKVQRHKTNFTEELNIYTTTLAMLSTSREAWVNDDEDKYKALEKL